MLQLDSRRSYMKAGSSRNPLSLMLFLPHQVEIVRNGSEASTDRHVTSLLTIFSRSGYVLLRHRASCTVSGGADSVRRSAFFRDSGLNFAWLISLAHLSRICLLPGVASGATSFHVSPYW